MADERSGNLLHELFLRAANSFPCNIAVTFSGETVESITYHDLSKKVEDLSTYFKKIFSQNEVVGIYSRDCLNMPAILLAIMDASAAFYPISTAIQPWNVLKHLKESSIGYVLVENGLVQDFINLYTEHDNTLGTQLKVVANDLLNTLQFTMLKVVNNIESWVVNWSKDLAYVMQTSGTTGDPKAVFVPHSCIVPNIIHLSSIFEVTCEDVIYLASPYTFDPSIVQMFLAFHNGAKLLIAPHATKVVPEMLCQKLFNQHQVTIFQPTPSLLYYIGEDLVSTKLLSESSTLSVLAIGGESCPSLSTLRKWKHFKCKTRLYNIYGITEVSSWATCHRITDDELCIPVSDNKSEILNACQLGTPLSQTELLVYDDNGDVVRGNGIGHLWIGGHDRQCLLEGENEANVPVMRDSGDIVHIKDDRMWYLGRSDNQVKRFGHRINLDYIEEIVRKYTDVTSCTLVLEPTSIHGKLLHLYAVPKFLKGNTSEDLKKYKAALRGRLQDVLPRESQPDHVHLVWKLPLTHHGKVDKREILKIAMDHESQDMCYHSVDTVLSEMWLDCTEQNGADTTADKERSLKKCKSSLKRPVSGLDSQSLNINEGDMFMLQGGDSFKAVQFAERIGKWIRKSSGQPVNLAVLFEIISNKTFGRLVCHVEEILLNGGLGNCRSTELDVGSVENGMRATNTDLQPTSKLAKLDKDSENKNEKKISVRKNETCTCFVRRGSERCVCSVCEDSSNCLISHQDVPFMQSISWNWSVSLEKCIDASPLVVPSCLIGEGTVFIGSHSFLFMSVALSDGVVLWRTRLGGRIESSGCLSLCGQLIVVGCYDGKVYVLAKNNGQIIWTYQTQDVVKSSPCLDLKTGLIWVGSHDGCLYGLDIDRRECKMRIECGGGSCFTSPAISYNPHHVYVGTLAGRFLCVDAVCCEIIWLKRFEKPIFSSPLIQGDSVFVATVNGCLKCIKHCGGEVWEFCADEPIFSSPLGCTSQNVSTAGDVIIASHGFKVYRLSSKGKCRWSALVDGPVYATPCFARCGIDLTKQEMSALPLLEYDDVSCVIVVTTKGTMYLLAANDGRVLKTFSLPGEVFSSPVMVGRDIVIGCRNDYLYCIKLT